MRDKTEEEFKAADTFKPLLSNTWNPEYLGSRSLTHKWKEMDFTHQGKELGATGYSVDSLKKIGFASVETPESFKLHEWLSWTHAGAWVKSIEQNSIDWATAEALAFGSLLQEGYNVRLAGEDVERGTFS